MRYTRLRRKQTKKARGMRAIWQRKTNHLSSQRKTILTIFIRKGTNKKRDCKILGGGGGGVARGEAKPRGPRQELGLCY